jgi:hypothetical protein
MGPYVGPFLFAEAGGLKRTLRFDKSAGLPIWTPVLPAVRRTEGHGWPESIPPVPRARKFLFGAQSGPSPLSGRGAVLTVPACYLGGTETTNALPASCPSTTSRSRAMSAS